MTQLANCLPLACIGLAWLELTQHEVINKVQRMKRPKPELEICSEMSEKLCTKSIKNYLLAKICTLFSC